MKHGCAVIVLVFAPLVDASTLLHSGRTGGASAAIVHDKEGRKFNNTVENRRVDAVRLEHSYHVKHSPGLVQEMQIDGISNGQSEEPFKIDKLDQYIKWPAVSKFSTSTASLIACLWIMIVASLPLLIVKYEADKDLTKTQKVIFVSMWICFFGGIYLFTNVIYFQSAHFDDERQLTIIQAVYLLAQILTTVGYGDVTPSRVRGQVFVGLYVVFSVLILSTIVSEVMYIMGNRLKEYEQKLIQKLRRDAQTHPATASRQKTLKDNIITVPSLDYSRLLKASLAYVASVLAGILFYHMYPGEDKTIWQALYMSVITLSTVGFGAVTPATEDGQVFCAFWMVLGSAALIALVGAVTELHEQCKLLEQYKPDKVKQMFENCMARFPAKADKHEFLKWVLIEKGLVDATLLSDLDKTFEDIDSDDKGYVNKEAVLNYMDDYMDGVEKGTALS